MGDKLFIDCYDYSTWSKNTEESTDKEELIDKAEFTDVPPMLPLEGYEKEVKKRKIIKTFNSKRIIDQICNFISPDDNLYKLKDEIRQMLLLLYYHNKIILEVYNNLVTLLQSSKKI